MGKTISSIMHRHVKPVSMDDTVEEVEAMMRTNHISSAPVYDGDGALLGIITTNDLLAFRARQHGDPAKGSKPGKTAMAWEICTYRPIEVTPDTPLSEVAELMLMHKIHHVIVMDNERMQGIVSSLDFVSLYLDQCKA